MLGVGESAKDFIQNFGGRSKIPGHDDNDISTLSTLDPALCTLPEGSCDSLADDSFHHGSEEGNEVHSDHEVDLCGTKDIHGLADCGGSIEMTRPDYGAAGSGSSYLSGGYTQGPSKKLPDLPAMVGAPDESDVPMPQWGSAPSRSSSKSGKSTKEYIKKDYTKEEYTTVVFRNMPNDYRRDDFCELMDRKGLVGLYNFVYVPMDFLRDANLGYAFVNFSTHENALTGWNAMEGFCSWPMRSQKVLAVSWGELQGLSDHIERYQNSPVMHKSVPENLRPILLHDGHRVPFPEPTRRMRPPRMKQRTKTQAQ